MSADTPTVLAYGAWPSPLTAAGLAAGGVGVSGPACRAVEGGTEIWWSELRPAEAGRSVLVCRRPGESGGRDVIDEPWSARTRVHEYGGGAWWLGRDHVYFAHWSDQRLYQVALTNGDDDGDGAASTPVALTPEPPAPAAWRYADGREHPTDDWLVCVRERHPAPDADGGQPEAINELVASPTSGDGSASPVVLGAGIDGTPTADFVAAPRFSPDGRWLSWLRWDHPRMPWDGTELCVAPVFAGMRLGNVQVVAGGPSESICSPDWTSDGHLVFATDRSGWWNLHRWTPGSGTGEAVTSLDDAEIGGPQWVFGLQRWVERSDGALVVAVTRAAADELAVVDVATGHLAPIPTEMVAINGLAAAGDDRIVVVGATATSLPELVELDRHGATVAVHRPADDLGVDPAWFSRAVSVTVASGPSGEREAHAFVYPPTGPGLTGPDGELPPLVVMGHGGPTAHSSPALNLRAQYWTSRGFAVADVNYGGSSGFGRAYRRLLDDAWGVVDVEDCIAVATSLAEAGRVDPDRLAIRGGSAGGFTVLSALARSDVFAAGTNLFGVADLEALARDTHKFESRYLDGLIGPYPERRDLYVERSPISHVDSLSCPLLVLQGLEDEIVPPNQSEAIVAALAAKSIPHAYVAFEGEQHGFRQAPNIIRSYELELWFYGRVFGFTPADPIEAPDGAVGL